jgi:hypothetical protein
MREYWNHGIWMISQKVEFPLPWREGMKGRGINNLVRFLDSSPSPRPSPVKGEGVFLSFRSSSILGKRRSSP